MLAHGAEKPVQMWKKVDSVKVADEKIQASPARQAVTCDLDIVDGTRTVDSFTRHSALHHLGEKIAGICWLEL
jgi:hypothetical protein